jgi:bla regulator protein blaR1
MSRTRAKLVINLVSFAAAWLAVAVLQAQSPDVTDWQKAAGGKMAFEAASVKPTTLHFPNVPRPNMPFDTGNAKPPGGRVFATVPLAVYINFAYKLAPFRGDAFKAKLPGWATEDNYEIEATTEGNPIKDQLRLMMQSLLADRFKLAIHFETHEAPVFALTLVKPGETGPKLRPHAEGPPCPDSYTEAPAFQAPSSYSDIFPLNCEVADRRPYLDSTELLGARNITIPSLASALSNYGRIAKEVDRPVVDKTGLSGRFDFTIRYSIDPDLAQSLGLPVPRGPTFVEAVRQQLGLKLTSEKGPVQVLVVDHVERPTEN